MIDAILYSKNRAMQLDLLLRSVFDKCKQINNIFVLYTYSNDDFKRGYELVFSRNYNINIVPVIQSDFETNVKQIVSNLIKTEFFLGLCDDDVFIEETKISDLIEKYDETICALSLKAGLNITHNYPNIDARPPSNLIEQGNFIKWNWINENRNLDWGYPACINGLIYNKEFYKQILSSIHFINPPTFEGSIYEMSRILHPIFKLKPFMLSFKKTKILNVPINRIQTTSNNLCGEHFGFDAEFLNSQLLLNKRISVTNIYGIETNMANKEINILMEDI